MPEDKRPYIERNPKAALTMSIIALGLTMGVMPLMIVSPVDEKAGAHAFEKTCMQQLAANGTFQRDAGTITSSFSTAALAQCQQDKFQQAIEMDKRINSMSKLGALLLALGIVMALPARKKESSPRGPGF